MAIFHYSLQNISASKGKCSVAAAAYRSGEELYCERQDIHFKYEKNVGAVAFILKPEHAPAWCLNRERLWNEVEKKESGKNGRYAKEINIALPIELSEDEQEALIKNYCQEVFVNSGMVTDVAIHRRDRNNPHVHVMLTNRPFNPDGTWGKKSDIEYILDENGNKTYTNKGNVKKRKIPLVDWDKEETLIRWRREWAKHVNLSLANSGFTERVSAESFETDNIDRTPTIHEGNGYDNKPKKEYNAEVRQHEKDKVKYTDVKERIYTYERFDLLTKNLTSAQRKAITELSGTLKTFINFANIEDKKRMINNWGTSTYVKQNFGVDVAKTLQTIGEQERAIHEADKILFDMSKLLMEKEYPFIEIERLTEYEIKWIADQTVRHGLLTKEEIEAELSELRPHLIEKQVLLITKQPFISYGNLAIERNKADDRIISLLERHGRTMRNYKDTDGKTMEEFYGNDFKRLGNLFRDAARAEALKEVIVTHYNEVLGKAFPEADLKQITITQKELIYNMVMYYNPENRAMTLDDLFSMPEKSKFTKAEKEAGLRYICSGEDGEVRENKELRRILDNEALRNIFYSECREDESLDPDLLRAAMKITSEAEQGKRDAMKKENEDIAYPMRKNVGIYQYLNMVLAVAIPLFPSTTEIELRKRRAKNKKLAELEKSMSRKKGIQPHR